MRISATIFVILISTYIVNSSVLDPVIENVVHLKASKPPSGVPGIWKKKTIWKPRWVKEWKSAKVMKPIWRKVWSPIQIREWVPIPKPPPGWDSTSTKLIPVHSKPQKAPLKDSSAHDSYTVQSKVPLWDPVPYPESQQPPPPPIPQPLYDPCGSYGCDNSPSQTFNHQQISEIIGNYQQQSDYQNQEFSETVNHLTRLPPDGNSWSSPQPLPEFLIPPKYPETAFSQPERSNVLVTRSPGFQIQNSLPKWIPLPPVKERFLMKPLDQPEVQLHKNKTSNLHSNGDFIQAAELVGEYHYSVFDDLNNVPQPPRTENNLVPQPPRIENNLVPQPPRTENKHIPQPPRTENNLVPQPPRIENNLVPQPPRTENNLVPQLPQIDTKHITQTQSHRTKTKLVPQLLQIDIKHTTQPPRTENNLVPQLPQIDIKHTTQPPRTENNLVPQLPQIDTKHTTQPQRTQTKHILQQEAITPNHKIPQTPKPTASTTLKPSTETYPIYEIPRSVSPIFVPPQHRFSQPPTNITKLQPNTAKVQIVLATTPTDQQTTERTSTTTEPYEIVFASSLKSTTETVTKTPVIVVTPTTIEKS